LLCCIKYLLDIISPGNDFKNKLLIILEERGRLAKLKEMGFTENWRFLDVWKDK